MRRLLTFSFVIISVLGSSFIANSQGPSTPDDIPDVVVAEATDYFIQDPKLFYLNSPGCSPIREPDTVIKPDEAPGSVEQFIGRTAVHGAELREMYFFFYDPFCTPPDEPNIISNLVADDDYVYFVSNEQNALVRISENRLDWESTPPEVVFPHTARDAELVIVGDTIYILQTGFGSDGIYQVNKNTGVGSQLLTSGQTGTTPDNFQTDGIYLYWRYWTGSESGLRKYRNAPPSGPTTIASGVASYYPVAGNVVYIGFADVIRSYDHGTGTLSSPLYTSSTPSSIESINADGSALYFIQRQVCTPSCPGAYTLYRLTFGSSTPTPLFAPPVDPVQTMSNLQRYDGYLFFLHTGEIKRIRTNADPAALTNLRIDGIEINQAIQNDSNSVELVRGKRTVVRLFASSDGDSIPGIFARLFLINGSGGIIDGPLFPVNLARDSAYMRVQSSPSKDNLNESFTFFLPSGWVDDPTLRLQADLNPFRFPPEPTYTDNILQTGTFNLDASGRLETRFILFEYDSGGTRYRPDYHQDFLQTLSWIRRAYPLESSPGWSTDPSAGFRPSYTRLFDADLGGNVDGSNRNAECQARIIDPDEDIDPDLCTAWYVVCPALAAIRAAEGLPDSVFLVGMVPDDAGFPRGWACGLGVSTPSGSSLAAWDTDGSYSDWYAGHEIGHSQQRDHPTPAGDDPATEMVTEGCGHSRSDDSFPWMNAAIGDSTYRGFDTGDPGLNSLLVPRVYPSSTWRDMMSYCANQWISDYTYEGIKDVVPSGPASRPDNQLAVPYLQLSGVLFPSTNEASLTQVRLWDSLSTPPAPSAPGDYRIRLLDGGVQLAAVDFTPEEGEDDTALVISEFVTFPAGTDRVEITHPGTGDLVWAYDISANAPVVSDVQLVGAPSPVTGDITVQWTATDADGGSLTYDMLYSNDNGATWKVVNMGLTSTNDMVDTSELAGTGGLSDGRFKVIANDGLNQGESESPAFVMADKAPIITVLSPADGSEYVYGQEVYFSAEVYDPQTGSSSAASIFWRDQTNFILGSTTEFSQDNLLIGENIITLTAENNEMLTTTVTFSIFVNDELEWPEATLTAGPDQIGWHVGDGETALQNASISVSNSGDDNFTVSTAENAPWLSVSQSGGTTPLELTLTGDPAYLSPGETLSTILQVAGTSTAGTQVLEIPVTFSMGLIISPGGGFEAFLPIIAKP